MSHRDVLCPKCSQPIDQHEMNTKTGKVRCPRRRAVTVKLGTCPLCYEFHHGVDYAYDRGRDEHERSEHHRHAEEMAVECLRSALPKDDSSFSYTPQA